MKENGWEYENMQLHLPQYVLDHVRINMDQIRQSDLSDKPWWTNTSSGQFSVKSAWNLIRKREEETDFNKKIWVQGIHFKISFLTWKVWKNMILVATVMAHWNPNISPLCDCCEIPDCETVKHLFLKGEVADTVWKYFAGAAGLLDPCV